MITSKNHKTDEKHPIFSARFSIYLWIGTEKTDGTEKADLPGLLSIRKGGMLREEGTRFQDTR